MTAIFATGTGRCGTTILKRALLRHPDVLSIRGELRIITDPDGLLDLFIALTDRWEPFRADAALHRFLELAGEAAQPTSPHGRYPNHNLDVWTGGGDWFMRAAGRLVDALARHENAPGGWAGGYASWETMYEAGPLDDEAAAGPIRAFVDGIFAHAHPELVHWVDDTPGAALCHAELERVWGDRMKLIHIVRDPRDTVSSMCAVHHKAVANPKGRAWLSSSPVVNAQRLAGMLDRLAQAQLFTIRLENFARYPEPVMREVCDYCGLKPPPDIGKLVTVKGANIGRWRSDPLIDSEVLAVLDSSLTTWEYK